MFDFGDKGGFGIMKALIGVSIFGLFVSIFNGCLAHSAQTNAILDRKQDVELVRHL